MKDATVAEVLADDEGELSAICGPCRDFGAAGGWPHLHENGTLTCLCTACFAEEFPRGADA